LRGVEGNIELFPFWAWVLPCIRDLEGRQSIRLEGLEIQGLV
jgi:hypothetical protein